jgi:hypothetical protein
VVQGRREAIGLPGEENGAVPSGCNHEITLAKWKQQMKDFSARYKALESSLKATQEEDGRKAKEIGDWRRRFAEVQSTLKERIEKRARELASATAGSPSELKARAEKLTTIEASNLVFQGTDGSYYVFPRTIVRALDVKPGETLSYMLDAGGARIVKMGRPRELAEEAPPARPPLRRATLLSFGSTTAKSAGPIVDGAFPHEKP